MKYRQATTNDLAELKQLAINAWSPFKKELADEHWQTLLNNISTIDNTAFNKGIKLITHGESKGSGIVVGLFWLGL